jgi:hypothetical protein
MIGNRADEILPLLALYTQIRTLNSLAGDLKAISRNSLYRGFLLTFMDMVKITESFIDVRIIVI